MSIHKCSESEAIGMDWRKGYPRVVTYCHVCSLVMRHIPLDDAPNSVYGIVAKIIEFMRKRGTHS